MTLRTDRRSLLLTGTLGLGALALPGFSLAQALAAGFTHSVASGEPGQDTMLLWTRYVPADGGAVKLRAEISKTADFAKIVSGGQQITGPWRDHTAKITVEGLEPGTSYFYRFVAPDGSFSPVGRTKTLPMGNVGRFGIGVFSCANMPFGFFNAYGHAAARADIDLWVHLGDYLYEYKRGGYAPAGGAVADRWPEPATEMVHLADYRLRYASYRSDPDLQELHRVKPMLIQMDDHESTNNSWEGGAQNHQPDEGDWSIRKAAALQAFKEWMPVSETPWGSYDIGGLATLFRTESRLLARSDEPDLAPLFRSADAQKALIAFRDGELQDPARTMLGTEQEAWLGHAMRKSVRAGQKWQLVGFGTIMGKQRMPEQALDWIKPDAPARTRAYVQSGVIASKLGVPSDLDNWGGFPAARARFLKSAQAAGANLIVLCGDSHNAWAFDLGQDGKPAGVEFAGHSVTSPGYENSTATDPKIIAAGLVAANPELKWCDTSRRGYMALTLTPEKASNDWVFLDTVTQRTTKASVGHTAVVTRGRNVMA
ncbi:MULTISPECIES: alkaline phosphatase [Sphingomonas]|uniref:Alkaline phosphatase D n=1 Tax=Sphingomonas leidyi TaxID=68569 RepID=A0A7X5ZWC5_9SPHN|nr:MULTISPECIES: alkaline phosphatase D family protein [Sphingomonas]MBN8809748.1 alkaline phosphatase D family protein [Sphingomonas sp.]NIJ66090.1 alkaline phosphatase D [Sphingomonas leidyi]OJY50381.1 MAG: alkaline phosphatase [Sphingomonas sp. 67-41]